MSGGLYFLAALFGGAYWGTKYSNDKSAHERMQKEYQCALEERQANKQLWLSKVTNKELEDELEDKIYQRESDVMAELIASWGDYYDCDMPKSISYYNGKGYRYVESPSSFKCVNSLNLLRILMANRGLLTSWDAELGIDICEGFGNTAIQRRQSYSEMLRFVKAIDKKLREHGICERIYVTYYPSSSVCFPLGDTAVNGKVVWYPLACALALKIVDEEK